MVLPYTEVVAGSSTNVTTPTTEQINQGNNQLTPYDSAVNNGYYRQMSQGVFDLSAEVVNVIEEAGLTPNSSLTQLLEGLDILYPRAGVQSATTSTPGLTKLATSANVNAGTSTDTAITPAALAGAQIMRAHRGTSNQGGITSGTPTKIQFNTVDWDVGSYYDNTTNYRFLPTVAGYYSINASVALLSNISFSSSTLYIYKNGSVWSQVGDDSSSGGGNVKFISHSDIVFLNGSTDYIEIFASTSSGGTITFNNNNSTFFAATKVR